MFRPLLRCALFCFFLSPGLAHADSIENFLLTGSAPSAAGQPFGTLRIDTTLGQVLSVDLTTSNNTFLFNGGGTASADPSGVYYISDGWTLFSGGGGGFVGVDLVLPVASLVGYDGGLLCSGAYSCADGQSSFITTGNHDYDFLGGELIEEGGVAPEPAGVILLGTGMLGVLGGMAYRRRKMVAVARA